MGNAILSVGSSTRPQPFHARVQGAPPDGDVAETVLAMSNRTPFNRPGDAANLKPKMVV